MKQFRLATAVVAGAAEGMAADIRIGPFVLLPAPLRAPDRDEGHDHNAELPSRPPRSRKALCRLRPQ